MTPTLTIVNFYFEKKRGLANGILWSASGISTIVNPTMYRQLIDKYGIHGAMIIVGGILLNICVGASLFRLSWIRTHNVSSHRHYNTITTTTAPILIMTLGDEALFLKMITFFTFYRYWVWPCLDSYFDYN
jgi:hypothetical protein